MSHSVSNDPTEDDPTGNADGDSADAMRRKRLTTSVYRKDEEQGKCGKAGEVGKEGEGGEAVSNKQLFS